MAADAQHGRRCVPGRVSPEDLDGDREWIITESLIFRFMGVDMNGITNDNIDEFMFRNYIVSHIIGTPFRMNGEDADFTLEDIRQARRSVDQRGHRNASSIQEAVVGVPRT